MLLSAGDLDYSNRQVYFKHTTFSRAMMAINLRGKVTRFYELFVGFIKRQALSRNSLVCD